MKDEIIQRVVDKFYHRSEVGIRKYNTTLKDNTRDNYLKHLQEELMDACNYIEKLLSIDEEITMLVKKYPNDGDLGAAIRKMVK